MADYRSIADELGRAILGGTLAVGARLPPQRAFAHRRGIANATAARVYAELGRRGLVSGEVGRGTFVRPPEARRASAWQEHADAPIDMQVAVADLSTEAPRLARAVSAHARPDRLRHAVRATGPEGTRGAGAAAARLLARPGRTPEPESILFSASARNGIASALAAIARPGDRIGVEPITYPSVIRMAPLLGLRLVPLATDEGGVDVRALAAAHRARPLAGLYLQPTVHNPLGLTTGDERRSDLAAFLREADLPCVEDGVFSFLSDAAPLAALAPEQVIVVDGLSKRLGPGTGLGFVVAAAPRRRDAIAAAMRAGGWVAASLPLSLATEWIADGSVAAVSAIRRAEAEERRAVAADVLGGQRVRSGVRSFYLWLELPESWHADAFAAAAARAGVAVTGGRTFAVQPGHAPRAVRVAISSMLIPDLRRGLGSLRDLLAGPPPPDTTE